MLRPSDVVAVAAVARNGVIGRGAEIPWRLPGEQARFKRLTLGLALVMGRRTYESIGRPLPGRRSVVVTRDRGWRPRTDPDGLVSVCPDVDTALARARALLPDRPVMVAGGAEIYRAAWPATTVLELTEVPLEPEGDVFFPAVDPAHWAVVDRDPGEHYTVVRYRRRD
ncbi:dihydrofolate reductase [Friedmanniella endophytica]|uniref:Dihydrofolate reductase n=1 Tax=Microlunatus kandeliicorticis TaxID=1759536 RepID=A0A7W3IW10_9ACTN|nr:dihydrofolate reductase [Microlunatus kandeliicorticis]MBA8796150.1 dihydrofolate reductase [Microlunatus kandeliicorticis]